MLPPVYAVCLFCHPDISLTQNLGLLESGKEGGVCMCAYVFAVYMFDSVYFFNQLFFALVHKAWALDLFFIHRREVAQNNFIVCPSFPFVIPQAAPAIACLTHWHFTVATSAHNSFTALQSTLSPTPSSHLLFPLNMCLIALSPPH